MAQNGLLCADVPLRHYSLVTLTQSFVSFYHIFTCCMGRHDLCDGEFCFLSCKSASK